MFKKRKNKSNSVVGMEITRDLIQIVELEKISNSEDDFKITNHVKKDLPKGAMFNNDNVDSQFLGEILKDIAMEENLANKKVVCAIPNERSVIKTFTVPLDATDEEIENMIKSSSKTYAISGIETMAFDFYEDINKRTEEDKTIVLKMCPLELISSREDALLIGEFIPKVIETDDMAISRLLPYLSLQSEQDLGYSISQTDTALLIDLRRQNLITHTIKGNNLLSSKDELLKRDLLTEDQVLKQVVDLLKKSVFVTKSNSENFKTIFLSGISYENVNRLKSMLTSNDSFKNLDIIVADPLLKIKLAGVNPEAIMDATPSMIISCGLAMREISAYD